MRYILVVEDERIERETLIQILQEHIEDSTVDGAKNGIEALKKANEKQYDMICADINMPGMNGLDMIKQMRTIQLHSQFIILTSYNYFEYAQEAIRLGVCDFILKPYNIQEFIVCIRQHLDKNHQSNTTLQLQAMLQRDCLYAIISDIDEIELKRYIRQLYKDICCGFCLVMHDEEETREHRNTCYEVLQQMGYSCIHEVVHGLHIGFVMHTKLFEEEEIKQLIAVLEGSASRYDIGVGTIVDRVTQFYHSFEIAKNHLGKKIPIATQFDIQTDKTSVMPMDDVVQIAYTCIQEDDDTIIKKSLQSICDYFLRSNSETLEDIMKSFYESLIVQMMSAYPTIDHTQISILPFYKRDHVYQDLPLNIYLNLKKLSKLIEEDRYRNTNHFVKEAIKYIDQNYMKQIVLSDLAGHLNISPYYISKLLSNSLHKSFTELISEKRVEASKRLLISDEPIKSIAGKVGFQGQSYFNKIFKKYTGVTPKVYRYKTKD